MAASVTQETMTKSPMLSPHHVLPPIIMCDKDRDFLIRLNCYIDDELNSAKDKHNPEERFSIYRAAFDQVIEYVYSYKPLLTAIKAEYEDCIDVILRGQREAFYLSGKLKAMASEPSTLRNYRKRIDELDVKVGKIKNENDALRKELELIRKKKQEKRQLVYAHEESPLVMQKKKDVRYLQGLSLEQSTDVQVLTKELERIERHLRELMISHRTRYLPKDKQIYLKDHLSKKVQQRDDIIAESERLKNRSHRLKIAAEAAQSYVRLQPPHETIGDAVLKAFGRQTTFNTDKGAGVEEGMLHHTPSTVFEEDDPSREKEAEMMLEYIEKFNELLEDKKFEEAAIHATNSPKGILRTPETMNRFKELQHETTALGRSPLLAFCDYLMSSVPAYAQLPSQAMSLACAQVVLKENKLDLLSHWLSQDRMTLSPAVGHHLVDYAKLKPQAAKQCLAMAQKVFTDTSEHVQAVKCMIQQDRLNQALAYGIKNNLQAQDYTHLLKSILVTAKFVEALQHTKLNGRMVLPLGQLLITLIGSGHDKIACDVMKEFERKFENLRERQESLQQMVADDPVTKYDQWEEVVDFFQNAGYPRYAMNILAAIIVHLAADQASDHFLEIVTDDVNPEEEPQQLSSQLEQAQSAESSQAESSEAESDPAESPQAASPQAASPQAASPHAGSPQAASPQAEAPQAELQAVESQVTEPHPAEQQEDI